MMKCKTCGAELNGGEKVCPNCGNPVELENEREAEENTEKVMENTAQPEKKGGKKGVIIGAAAAAVVAAGAFAFVKMNAEDPKEVVISAFENIYTENQVNPVEELFGTAQFAKQAAEADIESGLTLVLDSCSEETINTYGAGSGIRVEAKYDRTNKANLAEMGVIYKDMDLLNLNMYYGNESLMMTIPELSSKVFTVDLSEGLADRITQSPLLGPIVESAGIDVAGIAEYVSETTQQIESGQTEQLNLKALYTRFKEGTQAQEKFKEALTVEKAEKGTFTLDGQEVTCKGYTVLVSKDSMMEFLRTSRDFFLNDQELKDMYLKQLEQSVKLAEMMGQTASGVSTEEMYQGTVEEMTAAVDQAIDFLDQALNDVNMVVYVSKDGRLAAVNGSTVLNGDAQLNADQETETSGEAGAAGTEGAASGEAEEGASDVNVTFACRLLGGSYLTQNLTVDVDLANGDENIVMNLVKGGTYDGKLLTNDLDVKLNVNTAEPAAVSVVYSDSYNADGGDYDVAVEITADVEADDTMTVAAGISGIIDQLEKGTSVHMTVDELKASVASQDLNAEAVLSGEFYYGPLTAPVTALEGDQFDVVAADESDWQGIIMEIYMGIMTLAGQLQF